MGPLIICWISKMLPLEQVYLHSTAGQKALLSSSSPLLVKQSRVSKKPSAVYCKREGCHERQHLFGLSSWAQAISKAQQGQAFLLTFSDAHQWSGSLFPLRSTALSVLALCAIPLSSPPGQHSVISFISLVNKALFFIFSPSLLLLSIYHKVRFNLCISQFAMTLFLLMQGSTPCCGWALASGGQAFGFLSDRMLSTVQGSIQSNRVLVWTVRADDFMAGCNLGQAGWDQTNHLSVMDANKFHDVDTTLIFRWSLNVKNLINYPKEMKSAPAVFPGSVQLWIKAEVFEVQH